MREQLVSRAAISTVAWPQASPLISMDRSSKYGHGFTLARTASMYAGLRRFNY